MVKFVEATSLNKFECKSQKLLGVQFLFILLKDQQIFDKLKSPQTANKSSEFSVMVIILNCIKLRNLLKIFEFTISIHNNYSHCIHPYTNPQQSSNRCYQSRWKIMVLDIFNGNNSKENLLWEPNKYVTRIALTNTSRCINLL